MKNKLNLFEDSGITSQFQDDAILKKLKNRSIEISRVLVETEKAVQKANEKNDTIAAQKLKDRAEQLKQLLAGAEISFKEAEAAKAEQDAAANSSEGAETDDASAETDSAADNQTAEEPATEDNEIDSEKDAADNAATETDEADDDANSNDTDDASDENNKDNTASSTGDGTANSNSELDGNGEGNTSSSMTNDTTDDENDADQISAPDMSDTSNVNTGNQSNGANSDASADSEAADNSDNDGDDFDPFAMSKNMSSGAAQQNAKQVTKEQMLAKIKEKLGALSGDARNGAIAGLKAVLSSRGITVEESLRLTEGFNNKKLEDMSDDEFADLINDTLDQIDKVSKVNYSNDIEQRRKNIMQDLNNIAKTRELQIEDNIELQKDFVKAKAREKETAKYTSYRSLSDFKINFYNTINNQVEIIKKEQQTYTRMNARYESENAIKKGIKIAKELDESIPIIDFYFDMSGSWTSDKEAMEIGKQAVATVKEFADKGEIKLNIFYFSDTITSNADDSALGNGTHAWSKIQQNIKATKAKNVVLMTDCDMHNQAAGGGTCVVDGCVWILWNLNYYTSGSPEIAKHLVGKQGTKQYSFGSGGRYSI